MNQCLCFKAGSLLPPLQSTGLVSLPLSLTDIWKTLLQGLRVAGMDLSHCDNLADSGLETLQGTTTLTDLRLCSCWRLTNAGLDHLRNVPLTRLDLSGCLHLSDEGLGALQGMPLTELGLNFKGRGWLSNVGLEKLCGLPLRTLRLRNCIKVTGEGLRHLRDMPLSNLNLEGLGKLGDAGLAQLRGLSLITRINLCGTGVSDSGIGYLSDIDAPHFPGVRMVLWGESRMSRATPLRRSASFNDIVLGLTFSFTSLEVV